MGGIVSGKRLRVQKSPIHGRGLFARVRFRKGALIGCFRGRPTRSNGAHVLWILQEDGSETGIRGENELRFVNHSSRPNAEFWGPELYAIRTIQAGEEITHDYGEGWEPR